jgi:hypothetical protein
MNAARHEVLHATMMVAQMLNDWVVFESVTQSDLELANKAESILDQLNGLNATMANKWIGDESR